MEDENRERFIDDLIFPRKKGYYFILVKKYSVKKFSESIYTASDVLKCLK